ncbi:hypothetical protein [Sphingobacterium sp. LRF_L2]|uniref:hypothetical protein n=1 Tax=Sphingobacterium sp. LRF_L2 TaxID=3369421 RepID=UPI003F5EAD35
MPAKDKYLSSTGQRTLKITAGLFGGYMLSTAIHLAMARIPDLGLNLLVSGAFFGFLLWTIFMVVAFLATNGWRVWGYYILLTLIMLLIAYQGGTL